MHTPRGRVAAWASFTVPGARGERHFDVRLWAPRRERREDGLPVWHASLEILERERLVYRSLRHVGGVDSLSELAMQLFIAGFEFRRWVKDGPIRYHGSDADYFCLDEWNRPFPNGGYMATNVDRPGSPSFHPSEAYLPNQDGPPVEPDLVLRGWRLARAEFWLIEPDAMRRFEVRLYYPRALGDGRWQTIGEVVGNAGRVRLFRGVGRDSLEAVMEGLKSGARTAHGFRETGWLTSHQIPWDHFELDHLLVSPATGGLVPVDQRPRKPGTPGWREPGRWRPSNSG